MDSPPVTSAVVDDIPVAPDVVCPVASIVVNSVASDVIDSVASASC